MIQTFSYRTEKQDKKYQHTIHSVDISSSVEKWIKRIEDLQDQVYSFDESEVENIRQQFLSGQLNFHLTNERFS